MDKLRQEPDRVHVGPENLAGGFDERLLVDPPSDIPKCPVCIAVLKEPHLMSCCGAHICQVCTQIQLYYIYIYRDMRKCILGTCPFA